MSRATLHVTAACADGLAPYPSLTEEDRVELLQAALVKKGAGVKKWATKAVSTLLAGSSKAKYKSRRLDSGDLLLAACALVKRHGRAMLQSNPAPSQADVVQPALPPRSEAVAEKPPADEHSRADERSLADERGRAKERKNIYTPRGSKSATLGVSETSSTPKHTHCPSLYVCVPV